MHAIRDAGGSITTETDAKVLVTGTTAMNIDFSQKLNDGDPCISHWSSASPSSS